MDRLSRKHGRWLLYHHHETKLIKTSRTPVGLKSSITFTSKALAIDEAKYDVRVNTLSPGNVWTPLWESCANDCDDPARVVQAGCDAQLNGRMGTIEEMGKICLFLAADATFCTGIGESKLPLSGNLN